MTSTPDYSDEYQISEEEIPYGIFNILDEWVAKRKYELKLESDKNENILEKLITLAFVIAFLSVVLIFLVFGINQSNPLDEKMLNIFFGFLIIINFILYSLLGLIAWRSIITFIKIIKNTKIKAIQKVRNYNSNSYYQIIQELGSQFTKNDLSKAEVKFRAIINQIKDRKGFLSKLNPFLAITIVILIIFLFGVPNFNQQGNQIFSPILSASGIITIVKIFLDIYIELISKDLLIYEQCILILQKAQNIAG